MPYFQHGQTGLPIEPRRVAQLHDTASPLNLMSYKPVLANHDESLGGGSLNPTLMSAPVRPHRAAAPTIYDVLARAGEVDELKSTYLKQTLTGELTWCQLPSHRIERFARLVVSSLGRS